MNARRVLLVMLVAILMTAAFFGGMAVLRWREAHQQRVFNTSTVIQQIQTLSELVTVKYVIEKVVILEDARWYGENRLLLLAHGIVKAGIDLSELKKSDISIDGKKISLKLPPPKITDAYLDDKKTEVIERTTGLVRQFDKDLETNARRAAVADIRTAARVNGIIKDARDRAELQMKSLLLELGFSDVSFSDGAAPSSPPEP
jgi:hypothetical protein